MRECEVDVGGHTLKVREAGDPEGKPLVYFHGTPSCRLEAFADRPAAELGVRLVSFDRPSYGEWLDEHLPTAALVPLQGVGHMRVMEHASEILATLTGD